MRPNQNEYYPNVAGIDIIPNSQFSILHSPFSILHSPFPIPNSPIPHSSMDKV
ncbi:MAG: hypothetical protein F6K41_44405 [Symploca sp. SIO3E6]|nr:hypothetical protein [Caldora sp. SIO3E6]